MSVEEIDSNRNILSKQASEFYRSNRLQNRTTLKTIQNNKKTKCPSLEYSVEFSTNSRNYCVGFIDIVNSTKISSRLTGNKLSRYYEIFLNSISTIIEKFGGQVIKNVGDGLLYYFPNYVPSSELVFSNCLNCGLVMLKAQKTISDKLVLKKLPNLNFRISADFGNVIPMNVSVSSTIDLIGHPVNTSAKINRYAGNNEFVIGHNLYHFAKEILNYEFEKIKSCDVGLPYPYCVYRVPTSN